MVPSRIDKKTNLVHLINKKIENNALLAKFFANSVICAIATLFERGSFIIASFVASIALPAPHYSVFGTVQITINLLAGYATLGMSTLVTKLTAEIRFRESDPRQIKLIFLITAGIALLAAVVYVINAWLRGELLGITHGAVYLIGALATAISVIASAIFLGFEKYRTSAIISFLLLISMLVSMAAAQYYSTLNAFLIALILSYLIWSTSALFASSRYLRQVTIGAEVQQNISVKGSLPRDAVTMMVISAMTATPIWFINTILVNQTNAVEHARFLIGIQWSALASFAPSVLTRVTFPKMISDAKNGPASRGWTLAAASLSSIMLTLILAFVAFIFSVFIDEIYDHRYDNISSLIITFILCSVPASLANLFGNQLVAEGRIGYWLIAVTTGVAMIIASVIMLSALGALAAAISLALGYGVMVALAIFFLVCLR